MISNALKESICLQLTTFLLSLQTQFQENYDKQFHQLNQSCRSCLLRNDEICFGDELYAEPFYTHNISWEGPTGLCAGFMTFFMPFMLSFFKEGPTGLCAGFMTFFMPFMLSFFSVHVSFIAIFATVQALAIMTPPNVFDIALRTLLSWRVWCRWSASKTHSEHDGMGIIQW